MHLHIFNYYLFGSPSNRLSAIFLLAGLLFLPSTDVSADSHAAPPVELFNATAYKVPYDAPPPVYVNNQLQNVSTSLRISLSPASRAAIWARISPSTLSGTRVLCSINLSSVSFGRPPSEILLGGMRNPSW